MAWLMLLGFAAGSSGVVVVTPKDAYKPVFRSRRR